jgi:hypothetical protein
MSVREKEYLTNRITDEFNPILDTMQDRLIPVKERFREKLFKSLGLSSVEAKVKRLVKQVETLNRQFREVTGTNCVDIAFQTVNTSGSGWADGQQVFYGNSPFARAVAAKVKASKEARSLVEAEASLKGLKDTVMLAGFPGELVQLMKVELPAASNQFRRLAGLPDTPRQLTSGL